MGPKLKVKAGVDVVRRAADGHIISKLSQGSGGGYSQTTGKQAGPNC